MPLRLVTFMLFLMCGIIFSCMFCQYDEARKHVERARKCLATELAALVSFAWLSVSDASSYNYNYGCFLLAQMLHLESRFEVWVILRFRIVTSKELDLYGYPKKFQCVQTS